MATGQRNISNASIGLRRDGEMEQEPSCVESHQDHNERPRGRM